MEYSLNPQVMFGLSFSVPAEVADRHLKLAGAVQLKALLWLLRHAAEHPTSQDIAKALNIHHADICDAIQYWVQAGIILEDGQPAAQQEVPEYAAVTVEEVKVKVDEAVTIKPTAEQIAKRAKESPEIKFLLNTAQEKLGRTIGYDTQATLLMICDSYGLPVEVLLMLIDYCVSINKSAINYISKVAKTWSEKEIDTIEKADEQIQLLRRCEGLWKELCRMTGISTPRPTATQSAFLYRWSNELGFDTEMIYIAYEEMANHTDKISFPYMNKILLNWHDAGIRTPQQLEENKAQQTANKKPANRKKKESYEASYDIDEFNRRSDSEPLVYKKNLE